MPSTIDTRPALAAIDEEQFRTVPGQTVATVQADPSGCWRASRRIIPPSHCELQRNTTSRMRRFTLTLRGAEHFGRRAARLAGSHDLQRTTVLPLTMRQPDDAKARQACACAQVVSSGRTACSAQPDRSDH
jgi:hypothetical protein